MPDVLRGDPSPDLKRLLQSAGKDERGFDLMPNPERSPDVDLSYTWVPTPAYEERSKAKA